MLSFENGQYLRATPLVQSDHPDIRRQAAKIVSPDDSDAVKAEKLVAWVHRNVEKKPVLSIPNALETLANRVGDCNEHAVLLAALARAAGIPAQIEAGLVYLKGRFFYHAWNEIYVVERKNGRPDLFFEGRAAALAAQLGVCAGQVSISHDGAVAVAQVVLESAC